MSRATRAAGDTRRGSFGSIAPFAFGVPLAVGILAAITSGMVPGYELERYTQHTVEKVEVVLFCCAVCVLAGKLLAHLRERLACANPPLPDWDGKPVPVAHVETLWQQLALQPARLRRSWLGRRVGAVLDFVSSRGSAHELDDQLRCLADNDAMALEGSYALLRLIIWAIPILGFLGTVLGITQAISGVSPEQLEHSLSGVTDGLSQAFDATAMALFLTMILMFLCYLVERMEQAVIEAIDRYVDEELAHRFERPGPSGASAEPEHSAPSVLAATQQLLERHAGLWTAAVEKVERHWAEQASRQQERLAVAIQQALEFALTRYGKRLAELEETLLSRNQALLDTFGQLTASVRDTGREHQESLGRLSDGLAAQVAALTKLQAGEGELMRLQELLGQNLGLLAGAGTFEQAVQSLTAAVHLLSARTAPQAPALRLAPRPDAA
jgi:hypothetical protein